MMLYFLSERQHTFIFFKVFFVHLEIDLESLTQVHRSDKADRSRVVDILYINPTPQRTGHAHAAVSGRVASREGNRSYCGDQVHPSPVSKALRACVGWNYGKRSLFTTLSKLSQGANSQWPVPQCGDNMFPCALAAMFELGRSDRTGEFSLDATSLHYMHASMMHGCSVFTWRCLLTEMFIRTNCALSAIHNSVCRMGRNGPPQVPIVRVPYSALLLGLYSVAPYWAGLRDHALAHLRPFSNYCPTPDVHFWFSWLLLNKFC